MSTYLPRDATKGKTQQYWDWEDSPSLRRRKDAQHCLRGETPNKGGNNP